MGDGRVGGPLDPVAMMPGRRECLRVGGMALAAFCGVGGCGQARPLRIALDPWIGYQFMTLARQDGWLPPSRVELLEFPSVAISTATLATGRVDGAALTLDEVLSLREQGLELSVVLVFDVSAGADALLASPHISSLAELKGKRLAVESSTLGVIMLAKVLEAAGLERGDVTVVPMDQDRHLETWNSQSVDAIITYQPVLEQLQALGLVRLFDSRSLPQLIVDVLAMRTEVLISQAAALRELIAAHFQGLKRWRDNPIDTAYRLSARLGVKPEEVKSVFNGIDLPDAIYNMHYLSKPADELTQTVTEIAQIMLRQGLLRRPANLDRLFDPAYLPGENQ